MTMKLSKSVMFAPGGIAFRKMYAVQIAAYVTKLSRGLMLYSPPNGTQDS